MTTLSEVLDVRRRMRLLRGAAGTVYDAMRAATPAAVARARAVSADRAAAIAALDRLSRQGRPPLARRALVDAMWENPNYWLRFAMARAGLGLDSAEAVGLRGRWARREVAEALTGFGIEPAEDFLIAGRQRDRFRDDARRLIARWREPADILACELPDGLPPAILFDGVLKRQRRATVDLSDPMLADYVAEGLACIDRAGAMFDAGGYDLVLLSHALNLDFSAIAWAAIRRGIPVVVLYGDYESTRFLRLGRPGDLFLYPSRPSAAEIEAMPAAGRERLASCGATYIDNRLAGRSGDIGALYAYQRRRGEIDRAGLCARFGWDPDKPVIGIYASNWFDFPHCSGLTEFTDFLDWITVTLDIAAEANEVNWLFKAHPCDEWYGGVRGATLADLVARAGSPHIALADTAWNGRALIEALDGVVTCHGTIGVEAAALGVPVLAASRSWYMDGTFVIQARDRAHYLSLLRGPWWRDWQPSAARQAACEFAGWYFCLPDWHGGYAFPDDSRQSALYVEMPGFLDRFAAQIAREIDLVAEWYSEGHPYYHIYKMSRAESFQPGPLREAA